jgi:hypothetical protein
MLVRVSTTENQPTVVPEMQHLMAIVMAALLVKHPGI